jgi:hypothetical protein
MRLLTMQFRVYVKVTLKFLLLSYCRLMLLSECFCSELQARARYQMQHHKRREIVLDV